MNEQSGIGLSLSAGFLCKGKRAIENTVRHSCLFSRSNGNCNWVFAEIDRLADLASIYFLNITSTLFLSDLTSVVTHSKMKLIILNNILVVTPDSMQY